MQQVEAEIMSLQEVARFLAVSPRTVRRLVERGLLVRRDVGPHPAFRWNDLLRSLGLEQVDVPQGPQHPLQPIGRAAERIGCPPEALRQTSTRGWPRMVRVGGSVRWLPAEIDLLSYADQAREPFKLLARHHKSRKAC
ncbi:helix-turn-helix domain-containing protein [Tranquillimonas alkanivorans]|uniref:Helix-turn-helix domain-containing protein n=1 Tax=Tranquillimonas alkanivorans TaxID=441119 RepID=A0A1I5W057_9RHOB|nr:helix-turn-helix domain-containing protein [Tranquillimonas alkanivorans]SFQ13122.1 hypothetical protein SAMN04488047_13814 [Tranquillimonas alkanivorans]